jgi:hypothetical protein
VVRGWSAPSECGGFWYRFFRRKPQYVPGEEFDPRQGKKLRAALRALLGAFGRPVLFKNLHCSLRLEPLSAAIPEALFIFIRRDVVDNAHSLLEARREVFGHYAGWWSMEPPQIRTLETLPPEQQVVEQVRSINALVELARKKRRLAVLPGPAGERLTIRGEDADRTRILPVTNGTWSLDLHYKGGQVLLEGDAARRATALIMPKVNSGGAARATVHSAVDRIEMSGDPERFMSAIARAPVEKQDYGGWRKRRYRQRLAGGLGAFPLETRLAVEMAVNEENERRALEGELALLELEWKEAEEIAGIADRLGNESIEEEFEALKRRERDRLR